jgi:hypothetical protein
MTGVEPLLVFLPVLLFELLVLLVVRLLLLGVVLLPDDLLLLLEVVAPTPPDTGARLVRKEPRTFSSSFGSCCARAVAAWPATSANASRGTYILNRMKFSLLKLF